MTGSYHNPVIQRNSLYVLKVLETVIPELGWDRQATTQSEPLANVQMLL